MSEYKVDYARASALLDIVQKVSTVSPQYMAIASEAMAELKEMNQKLTDQAVENKKAADRKAAEEAAKAAKIEADRVAKEEEAAKAQADRQAKAPKPVPPIIPGQPVPPEAHPIAPEPVTEHKVLEPAESVERKI